MPLYEYRCSACSHVLEIQQRLAEAPLKKCPRCKKSRLQKQIGATSFQLKGDGWFKDLYAPKQPGPAKNGNSKTEAA
jgi:putative FmdB family regulatory protein